MLNVSDGVKAALVVLVAAGLQWAAEQLGLPLDQATVNSLAFALVTYFLALFAFKVVKRLFPTAAKNGLLADE